MLHAYIVWTKQELHRVHVLGKQNPMPVWSLPYLILPENHSHFYATPLKLSWPVLTLHAFCWYIYYVFVVRRIYHKCHSDAISQYVPGKKSHFRCTEQKSISKNLVNAISTGRFLDWIQIWRVIYRFLAIWYNCDGWYNYNSDLIFFRNGWSSLCILNVGGGRGNVQWRANSCSSA